MPRPELRKLTLIRGSRAAGTKESRVTTPIELQSLIAPVARFAQGRALDAALQADLNLNFPATGELFQAVNRVCHDGIAAGWLCREGDAKRRFGRVFEPCDATYGFSIDVVDITDLVGNHHRHPTGEIDMIMPVTPEAKFDDRGAGWLVYAANSGHRPTVTAGRALVLYLLPEGKIEWTAP